MAFNTRVPLRSPYVACKTIVHAHVPVAPLFISEGICRQGLAANNDCTIQWVIIHCPSGPDSPLQPFTLPVKFCFMYMYQFGHFLGLTRYLLVEPICFEIPVPDGCTCRQTSPSISQNS